MRMVKTSGEYFAWVRATLDLTGGPLTVYYDFNGGNATDVLYSVTVQSGTPVQFVFRNGSSTSPHTFTIAALGLDLKADPGGSESATLKHLKAGTYQFICTIPGHAQLGMKGTLVVK